ncbi:lysM and putative peptidoglycan-binding domain-containing protein 4 [Lampris incognitus]|uniref:lysM and putative peptidoglycan-binding domain-containing protein 4 n=1 Tax=Lampris incognitus TaxID=2546036 RepID=UPI0024B6047B|nr:lysM and putative peptidoglycan-binding domain-containing protein 4 [Lampris incognitus]
MMRRGELHPHAFQAPVDVHASADGQVYMFRKRSAETAGSSEDEDLNVLELRPRIRQEQDRLGNVQLLEREVLDGDNLNKLALRYGCKVADIKRVNNLIHEQDLFALKSVKIPVQKHSFLTETYTILSDAPQEMANSTSPTATQPQDRDRVKPQLKEVTDFLKEVDNDIEKLIQSTSAHNEDNSEMPLRFGARGQRLTSYGADWGIQWWNAVVAMLLIGIILPLFYVVYFKTKDSEIVSALNSSTGMESSVTSSNHSGTGPRRFQQPG